MGVRGSRKVRVAGLTVIVAIGIAGAAPSASAAVTASATCTPAAISFPNPGQLDCAVNIQTGAQAERFTVAARVPTFTGGNFPGGGEGPTIGQLGMPVLDGPGTPIGGGGVIASEDGLLTNRTASRSVVRCSTVGGTHGSFNGSYFTSYEIPPASSTTVRFRFEFAQPPWPYDSIAPTFLLQASAPGGSTLPADIVVPVAEPLRTGQSGVRIVFSTKPPSGGITPGSGFKVRRPVTIAGATDPVVANQNLRIFYVRSTEQSRGDVQTMANVRTNAGGGFSHQFVPVKPGYYEVGVTYTSQRADLADDFACSKYFTVEKSKAKKKKKKKRKKKGKRKRGKKGKK